MSEIMNNGHEEEPLDPEELVQALECKPVYVGTFTVSIIIVYVVVVFCAVLKPYLLDYHH